MASAGGSHSPSLIRHDSARLSFFTAMLRKYAMNQWNNHGVKKPVALYYGPEPGTTFGWPMDGNRGKQLIVKRILGAPNMRMPGFGMFSCGPT